MYGTAIKCNGVSNLFEINKIKSVRNELSKTKNEGEIESESEKEIENDSRNNGS